MRRGIEEATMGTDEGSWGVSESLGSTELGIVVVGGLAVFVAGLAIVPVETAVGPEVGATYTRLSVCHQRMY